jgi:hypothetical protein
MAPDPSPVPAGRGRVPADRLPDGLAQVVRIRVPRGETRVPPAQARVPLGEARIPPRVRVPVGRTRVLAGQPRVPPAQARVPRGRVRVPVGWTRARHGPALPGLGLARLGRRREGPRQALVEADPAPVMARLRPVGARPADQPARGSATSRLHAEGRVWPELARERRRAVGQLRCASAGPPARAPPASPVVAALPVPRSGHPGPPSVRPASPGVRRVPPSALPAPPSGRIAARIGWRRSRGPASTRC